jgi:hypothetical protein
MADPQPSSFTHVFEPLPLSRARAYLSLTFGGLALLLIGGVLSYASGSPDVHGTVSTYWTVFFSFHALAFGGAALLGAFPRVARWPVKLGWLLVLLVVLVAAVAIRAGAAGAFALGPYAVALLPVSTGLWWRGEPPQEADRPGNSGVAERQ